MKHWYGYIAFSTYRRSDQIVVYVGDEYPDAGLNVSMYNHGTFFDSVEAAAHFIVDMVTTIYSSGLPEEYRTKDR